METAEPPQEAWTPAATIPGFLRGSQAHVPGPKPPESHRHSETLQGHLRNVSGCSAEIVSPFPEDSSTDVDTHQEIPATNQETPEADPKTPVYNQETPAASQENPETDQDTPVYNQETPETDQETPTANQETPASNQETPASNQETPASNQETPASNQETPASNQETPASNQETPASNQETPTSNQETPAADLETPETDQDIPAAEHQTADRQASMPTSLEFWGSPVLGHMVPLPSELDRRPEAERLAWGAGHADEQEEASPDSPAVTSPGPPWREHPAGTSQPREEPQEGCGQAECTHPRGAPEWEGTGQREAGFQVVGRRGEQRRDTEQEEEGAGARGLGVLTHGQWGQEESDGRPWDLRPGGQGGEGVAPGLEGSGVADPRAEEKPEEVPGKQGDQGLSEVLVRVLEQGEEAGVSDGESGNQARGGLGTRGEQVEHSGPGTLAPLFPGIPPPCDLFPDASCPITGVPQAQVDPWAGNMPPLALTPVVEPGQSHLSMSTLSPFLAWGSPDKEASRDGQHKGPEQEPASRAVSVNTLGTLPQTLDSSPGSPAPVSPCSVTSLPAGPAGETRPAAGSQKVSPASVSPCSVTSLPAGPAGETRPAAGSPEVSTTFLCGDSPTLSGAAPDGSTSTEDTWNLCHSPTGPSSQSPPVSPMGSPWQSPPASLLGSPRQSPVASPMGTCVHLRSSSFTGPHRTKVLLDMAARSLSFSHLEPPQRPPKPAIFRSVTPRRDSRGEKDSGVTLQPPAASSALWQGLGVPQSQPKGPGGASPWPYQQSSPPAAILTSVDGRVPEPPPPLEKRGILTSTAERDSCVRAVDRTLQWHSRLAPLAHSSGPHGPPKGPVDSLVARQLRPLPSTPDFAHLARTSLPPRARYNKPLPPTPDDPQFLPSPSPSSRSPRTYKPLPPLPILDPPTEPPPLPPKARARSRSTQGGLMSAAGQARLRPGIQDWSAPLSPLAGRTSWPPATGQSTNTLAPASRGRSDTAPGMAFSNMTNLLSLSSPITDWPPEDVAWLIEEPGGPTQGPSRRAAPQEGPLGSELGGTRPPERPGHQALEKSSSWPHRGDMGRHPAGSSGPAPGEEPSRTKGWNRQGLRRPSVLSMTGTVSDTGGPTMEPSPDPTDTVVFREKKPKEALGVFSRRRSKLVNSSQLLYQEYSDVFLNKEIQSQQRLDSLAESPGLVSPRQPRKAPVPSESCLQLLSSASSGSLWQEIPAVRNSAVLLSMTHEDQKLQEAKFELIVSEASYLRSLNVAVDHFQLSSQLRATLSNQEHQWLFSRLQDVRDVSTTFLSDLEENLENNIFTFHVCDVVLNHAPHFRRVYLPYVTNQTYQERTFQSLLNSSSHFREVLEKLESDPVCQRLSLKSFLILPFQRITRLKLLLQNILKRTQPGSLEEAEATKAHHALEELIRDCNNNVQRMRRTEELIYLSQKIEFECKIFPLISQSRWLVKSGELTALEFSMSPGLRRKLNTRPVHLHLFNDCLLLSRPREGSRFLVFDHAPFSEIRGEKCEMKLHGAHKNLFRLFLRRNTQGAQAEFLFSTETQSEKLRWISALALPREEMDLLECHDSPQVQCLRAYKPRENDELALEKADVVMVTQQSSDGWLEGVRLSDGERGWFPLQQVKFISNADVRAQNLKEAQRVKTARLQLAGR